MFEKATWHFQVGKVQFLLYLTQNRWTKHLHSYNFVLVWVFRGCVCLSRRLHEWFVAIQFVYMQKRRPKFHVKPLYWWNSNTFMGSRFLFSMSIVYVCLYRSLRKHTQSSHSLKIEIHFFRTSCINVEILTHNKLVLMKIIMYKFKNRSQSFSQNWWLGDDSVWCVCVEMRINEAGEIYTNKNVT